jgi:hypothetical protein
VAPLEPHPITTPDGPAKTKLGLRQLVWLHRTIERSDAAMFVVFSADILASRYDPRDHKPNDDCFLRGWPDEYRRVMALFMDVQLGGRRVLVMSGDAHGLRIHYHPDPLGRPAAEPLSVVEFICSGLRPGLYAAADPADPTVDPRRHVIGHPGAGMLVIEPPGSPGRSVTLRAINADRARPPDAFPPLRLGCAPGNDRRAAAA